MLHLEMMIAFFSLAFAVVIAAGAWSLYDKEDLDYPDFNYKGETMDFSKIQELLNQLPQLLATIEALKSQATEAAALVEIEKAVSYQAGFEAGVASVPVSTKIYDQAEVDAMIAAAIGPVQLMVDEAKAQVEALKAELEAAKSEITMKIDEAVASAKSAFKAELLAQYEAQQVAESEGETGFAALLK